jgi:hypothetical protein
MLETAETQEAISLNPSCLRSTRPIGSLDLAGLALLFGNLALRLSLHQLCGWIDVAAQCVTGLNPGSGCAVTEDQAGLIMR